MEKYLESLVSPNTRKSYRNALISFEKWYKKPLRDLLKEPDPVKTIELYFVYTKQKHCQNTARSKTNPVIQWLKYNNVYVNLRKGLGIYRSEITTRDHLLTINQAREMYKIANLDNKVLVKTWLLGLRISDACRLKWKDFNLQPQKEPIEVLILTRKESVIAHCFVDQEFQELLQKYISTLDQNNDFLFQSARQVRLSEKQLLRRLQKLAKKVRLNTSKRFGWHIGRKLFLRKTVNLGLNQWSAKMMVGKSVDKSIATYIQGTDLTKDAIKMSYVLRMEQLPQVTAKGEEYIEAMLDALRELLRDKLASKGLSVTTVTPNQWQELYQKLLPPHKRKEKVQL